MTNYEMQFTANNIDYDGVGNFEFPVNPITTTLPILMDRKIKENTHSMFHNLATAGNQLPREFVLQGTVFGSNKRADYNKICEFVNGLDFFRWWVDSDNFYYVVGTGIREVNLGEKTNFIDYVMTLTTISPFKHDNSTRASRTATRTISDANAFNIPVSGGLTNSGNALSVVTLSVTRASSGANITKIELGDSAVSGGAVQGNRKLDWSGSLAASENLVITPFKMINESAKGMLFSMRFAHPQLNGTGSKTGSVTCPMGMMPLIEPGTSQVLSCKLTGNNTATVVTVTWWDLRLS